MLEIKNLSIKFGAAEPVRDVALTIADGQAVGVVGESGSGKSLTALAVMGLLPQQARADGGIVWNGRDLLRMTAKERRAICGREIAMIFQDPMSSLNPSFTVGYQIDEVLRLVRGIRDSRTRRERGVQLLSDVGIPAAAERWNQYPHQMSGGMSQRVCIAMALAAEPKLLIADEPTTALDVTVQMQILALLAKLKKERGMSLLFVTHDLAVASRLCDDIAVFYAGRSVERGDASALLRDPKHPYTRALLASRPHDGATTRTRLQTIDGSVPRATEKPVGCAFASRCKEVFALCQVGLPVRAKTATGFSACHLVN